MKTKEIREKKDEELKRILAEEREKVREYNFKLAQEELKNHRDRRKAKRNIAQILTVLKERELKEEIKKKK